MELVLSEVEASLTSSFGNFIQHFLNLSFFVWVGFHFFLDKKVEQKIKRVRCETVIVVEISSDELAFVKAIYSETLSSILCFVLMVATEGAVFRYLFPMVVIVHSQCGIRR